MIVFVTVGEPVCIIMVVAGVGPFVIITDGDVEVREGLGDGVPDNAVVGVGVGVTEGEIVGLGPEITKSVVLAVWTIFPLLVI